MTYNLNSRIMSVLVVKYAVCITKNKLLYEINIRFRYDAYKMLYIFYYWHFWILGFPFSKNIVTAVINIMNNDISYYYLYGLRIIYNIR